ncbi:hypothetical protein HYFRA_00004111 [Hymenoscyphus fraxineus]|uniref:Uncharacterized protein n=1 Tax=Hymenoscyphus fraxineus TaxID=746836 RepID=A0A9N9KMM7_9HELO|nr:hypothetical protein HYFRA_00004111 [Hymenoscyphus fraxineus]
MCKEAFKRYAKCKAVLQELFVCADFIALTFQHPDALAIECPDYQILKVNYPSGRCNCATEAIRCEFAARNGERIITFEEQDRPYTEEAVRYNEWINKVGTETRFEKAVKKSNDLVARPSEEQIAYRKRLAAILETEMVVPPTPPPEEEDIQDEGDRDIQIQGAADHGPLPKRTRQMLDAADDEPLAKRIRQIKAPRVRPTQSVATTSAQTLEPVETGRVQQAQPQKPEETGSTSQPSKSSYEGAEESMVSDGTSILSMCNPKWKPQPHLQDSTRYKYLGEQRTPEEWATIADGERDRIMDSMKNTLNSRNRDNKLYIKQQRKMEIEHTRWETMSQEATQMQQQRNETRQAKSPSRNFELQSYHELLLYVNEFTIQKDRMDGEWGYIMGQLTELSLRDKPLPDVLEMCRSLPSYSYTPGQVKTPEEWLDIVEQERKRCIRALGSVDKVGKNTWKPRIINGMKCTNAPPNSAAVIPETSMRSFFPFTVAPHPIEAPTSRTKTKEP